jgi:signal peptidase I
LSFLKTLLKNKIFRVVAVLIILVFPFTSNYRVVFVHGQSMFPTYKHMEIVIEEKSSSLSEYWEPNRGDVIVVITKDKEKLVKRVIGLEGEYIRIKHGRIYINDKKHKDHWTHQDITFWTEPENIRATKPKEDWLFLNTDQDVGRVPKDHVWVIGDNRHMSWFGFVKTKEIEGKVLY